MFRHKRLDRLAVESMPEVHVIGHIVSGVGLVSDSSEGATCRYKFVFFPILNTCESNKRMYLYMYVHKVEN
jgi:hypothetical protein